MLSKYLADSPCPHPPMGPPNGGAAVPLGGSLHLACGSAGQTVLAFPLAFQPFCIDDAALLCANSTLTVAASAQPSSPLIPPPPPSSFIHSHITRPCASFAVLSVSHLWFYFCSANGVSAAHRTMYIPPNLPPFGTFCNGNWKIEIYVAVAMPEGIVSAAQ